MSSATDPAKGSTDYPVNKPNENHEHLVLSSGSTQIAATISNQPLTCQPSHTQPRNLAVDQRKQIYNHSNARLHIVPAPSTDSESPYASIESPNVTGWNTTGHEGGLSDSHGSLDASNGNSNYRNIKLIDSGITSFDDKLSRGTNIINQVREGTHV